MRVTCLHKEKTLAKIFLLWKTIATSVLSDSSCREAINQAANTRLGENDQIRHLKTFVTNEIISF
jgi:hypothetical protein